MLRLQISPSPNVRASERVHIFSSANSLTKGPASQKCASVVSRFIHRQSSGLGHRQRFQFAEQKPLCMNRLPPNVTHAALLLPPSPPPPPPPPPSCVVTRSFSDGSVIHIFAGIVLETAVSLTRKFVCRSFSPFAVPAQTAEALTSKLQHGTIVLQRTFSSLQLNVVSG